jgi:hypothetical protein
MLTPDVVSGSEGGTFERNCSPEFKTALVAVSFRVALISGVLKCQIFYE